MNSKIKDIAKYVRIILLRLRSMIISPLNVCYNSILIIAPHPDDECLGCAGLIQRAQKLGKTVNVIIMSGGGRSHLGCCDIDESVLIEARHDLTKNAAEILGLPLEHLHFLNYPDGNISFKCNETLRLAELITNVNANAVFVPHSGEGWKDHVETRRIIMQLLSDKPNTKMYEYCVWFWFYNTWHINWRQARVVKMSTMQHQTKLKAIEAYINPQAPCGKPWSGVLPPVFIKACRWDKELFIQIEMKYPMRSLIPPKRMKKKQLYQAIIIGDSTNNTLSAVRSLGEAKVHQFLILKCEDDFCFVCKSKYLNDNDICKISNIEECLSVLNSLKENCGVGMTIICTFDEAAEFIDANESLLYPAFRTPTKGKRIGNLFNKDAQCKLAEKCGLTIPISMTFNRAKLNNLIIDYPILLKPLNSIKGEKSDIHICQNKEEVEKSLIVESTCSDFIVQEYIEKEYEINCIGVRTEKGVFLAGGIKKIRHYPQLIGASAYGLFKPIGEYDINTDGIEAFLKESNYYGPFSIEFLHKGDKNYFMEVNFRNDGLAYTATVAGANLHAAYIIPTWELYKQKIHSIYMMNYSIDFLYVKEGKLSLISWILDLIRTRCFINICFTDIAPTVSYYKEKIRNKILHNR